MPEKELLEQEVIRSLWHHIDAIDKLTIGLLAFPTQPDSLKILAGHFRTIKTIFNRLREPTNTYVVEQLTEKAVANNRDIFTKWEATRAFDNFDDAQFHCLCQSESQTRIVTNDRVVAEFSGLGKHPFPKTGHNRPDRGPIPKQDD